MSHLNLIDIQFLWVEPTRFSPSHTAIHHQFIDPHSKRIFYSGSIELWKLVMPTFWFALAIYLVVQSSICIASPYKVKRCCCNRIWENEKSDSKIWVCPCGGALKIKVRAKTKSPFPAHEDLAPLIKSPYHESFWGQVVSIPCANIAAFNVS